MRDKRFRYVHTRHRRACIGDVVMFPQRTVRISRNPNGTHDVLLLSTMGVIICQRFIRKPRRNHA
jgi:hypothetical protein